MDYGFNTDVELPGGEWKITYRSVFSHLTGVVRKELARGSYGEMIVRLGTETGKFYDMKMEEV